MTLVKMEVSIYICNTLTTEATVKDSVKITEQASKEWSKGVYITLNPHSRQITVYMSENQEHPEFKDGYWDTIGFQAHEIQSNMYCLEEDFESSEYQYKITPVVWDCDKLVIEGEL